MTATDDVLAIADRLWSGAPATDGSGINPMAPGGGLA